MLWGARFRTAHSGLGLNVGLGLVGAIVIVALTLAGIQIDLPIRELFVIPVLALIAAWIGSAIARQRAADRQEAAGEPFWHQRARKLSTVAVIVFVAGTFTWRGRSAADLSSTPVDSAASVRLAADVLAIGLVFLAYTTRDRARAAHSSPRGWYLLYIVIVGLGATVAVDPALVLFRVFDLAAAFLVAMSAVAWSSLNHLVRLCRRILLTIAALIFAEAAAMPSLALEPARGGLVPFRLEGVFPIITYNSVGAFGVMLFALGVGAKEGRRLAVTTGLALVVLSQYRTGYLAVAAVILVFLIARRGAWSKVALIAAFPLGYYVVRSSIFQDAWTRGEEASNSVATLSGRTDYWAAAVQVARRSPVIGTGLSSGTRFEAFPLIGNDTASTIHGTWIEAYLGTGILGTAILAMFVLTSIAGGWRIRAVSLAPLLLIVSVLVRSATGTTIELAQITLVFVLMLAVKAAERPKPPRQGAASPSGSRQYMRLTPRPG